MGALWSPPGAPHRHSGPPRPERSLTDVLCLLGLSVLGLVGAAFVALHLLIASSDVPLVQF